MALPPLTPEERAAALAKADAPWADASMRMMVKIVALDEAILPPPDVMSKAIAYSAALPAEESQGLRLDGEHLPHITLTQQFVRHEELDIVFSHIEDVLEEQAPLRIRITGGGQSGRTLWLTVERTPELLALHQKLMDGLRGLERPHGGKQPFYDEAGRVGARDRVLAHLLDEGDGARDGLGARTLRAHHLHERQDGRGIEPVQAAHTIGSRRRGRDLGH